MAAGLPGLSAPARREARRRLLHAGLLTALVAGAWTALAAWSTSPYARYLLHDGWGDASALAALCRAVPGGTVVLPLALHAAGWALMIAAMMLPSTAPLLALFGRMTSGRRDAGGLLARVVAGYLAAWLGFGLVAHGADAALHALVAGTSWPLAYGWTVGAAVLAGAGAFQFSALKYRCLDACRTPLAFILARWHGGNPGREALRLGFDHGLFCIGCCWALMLVMFVVGLGSLGWMLVLAAAMAAEKTMRWGHRLRTPLGLGLIAWAAAIAVDHL